MNEPLSSKTPLPPWGVDVVLDLREAMRLSRAAGMEEAGIFALCRDAADEIERLRAALDKSWQVTMWRCLNRLHHAVIGCARIGFDESKPTTNAAHGAVWLDLNEAQKDAKFKLEMFSKYAERPADETTGGISG
jgi:hypothetical protein